ncbi:MAG: hypothetical protein K0S01_3414 [Herbinix sp.]|jgi:Fic family protein|nr:hypothetical protein [Herbinix sp.]
MDVKQIEILFVTLCDDNGRTSRIMMASFMYHSGYDQVGALPVSRCINDRLSK